MKRKIDFFTLALCIVAIIGYLGLSAVDGSSGSHDPTVIDENGAFRWADFDDDGLMDFYVIRDDTPGALYRNFGDGRFEEVSDRADSSSDRGAVRCRLGPGENISNNLISTFYTGG